MTNQLAGVHMNKATEALSATSSPPQPLPRLTHATTRSRSMSTLPGLAEKLSPLSRLQQPARRASLSALDNIHRSKSGILPPLSHSQPTSPVPFSSSQTSASQLPSALRSPSPLEDSSTEQRLSRNSVIALKRHSTVAGHHRMTDARRRSTIVNNVELLGGRRHHYVSSILRNDM